jgi:hypothetical protein
MIVGLYAFGGRLIFMSFHILQRNTAPILLIMP